MFLEIPTPMSLSVNSTSDDYSRRADLDVVGVVFTVDGAAGLSPRRRTGGKRATTPLHSAPVRDRPVLYHGTRKRSRAATAAGQGQENRRGHGSRTAADDLREAVSPIDLETALKLAGGREPGTSCSHASGWSKPRRSDNCAAAQILPNLNLGTNYNLHRGALQQE